MVLDYNGIWGSHWSRAPSLSFGFSSASSHSSSRSTSSATHRRSWKVRWTPSCLSRSRPQCPLDTPVEARSSLSWYPFPETEVQYQFHVHSNKIVVCVFLEFYIKWVCCVILYSITMILAILHTILSTHRVNTWIVGPGPTLGLIWRRPCFFRDLPYVCEGGVGLNLIVIFIPILGAILIGQTLRPLGIGNPIWM